MRSVSVGVLSCACLVAPPALGSYIAHSENDWMSAANDGIGAGGGAVTPGSLDDAAQQEHPDSSGSGTWSYRFGNNTTNGQSFGGGFPYLQTWEGTYWSGNGFGAVSQGGMAPLGPSFASDPMAYKRWTSNGSFAGETLTATITAELTNEFSDGVTIVLATPGADQTFMLEPSDLDQPVQVSIDFTDVPGGFVIAGIRPEGVNGPSASNHFNDSARVRLTITPAPSAAWALLALGTMRRRRSA